MDQRQTPPSRWEVITVGAICAAFGVYFVLASLGFAPLSGKVYAPMWILLLAGLCFLFGGLAVLIPAAVTGEVRADGELPAGTPAWLRILQYIFGLAILVSLASIGTWIAFGPGDRSFSSTTSFITSSGGSEMPGRVVFGFGAIITWLAMIAIGISGWRRLNRRGDP